MSKVSIIVASGLCALGFVAVTGVGCGSSSSSGDFLAVCNQNCDKLASCVPDAGAAGATAAAQCKMSCTTQSKMTTTATCPNSNAILSAFRTCLDMADCSAYEACLLTVPRCQGGSGSGGTTGGSGSGGTTGGSGGTTGGAGCAGCDKAGTCCVALAALGGGDSSGCSAYSAAMCNAAAGSQATFAMGCASVLTAGAALNIAACR